MKLLKNKIIVTGCLVALALVCYKLYADWQPDFYLGGIQINEPDDREWIQTLDAVGMNTVSVTVYARQSEWDSEELLFDAQDTVAVNEIRLAKAEGLRVTLILRILLDTKYPKNEFLWHGMIMPKTESQLATWFDTYADYVERWARISQREDVDLLFIGSEMNALSATTPIDTLPTLVNYYLDEEKQLAARNELLSFEDSLETKHLWVRGGGNYPTLEDYLSARQRANSSWAAQVAYTDQPNALERTNQRRSEMDRHWRKLIARVRTQFSGKLGYAANFDNYHEVGFWSSLDYIGINAYFKLRDQLSLRGPALSDSLTKSWLRIFAEIDSFRIRQNIPDQKVIFTELGYTYRKYATLEPWSAAGFSIVAEDSLRRLIVWDEQPIDYQERALAVRALFEAHKSYERRLLQGILYWKLSTKDYHLPYEPFMLHVSKDMKDPLLLELRKFVN